MLINYNSLNSIGHQNFVPYTAIDINDHLSLILPTIFPDIPLNICLHIMTHIIDSTSSYIFIDLKKLPTFNIECGNNKQRKQSKPLSSLCLNPNRRHP